MIGLCHTPRVNINDVLESSSVPDIPVFRPTKDEFQNFSDCISKIETFGAHHLGLCKVIPPPDWIARRCGYTNIDNVVINKPILQTTIGSRGIYLQNILPRKDITFGDFKSLTLTSPHCAPNNLDYNGMERKYWSTIGMARPLYGANVSGSLMDKDQLVWNVADLKSILSDVLVEENVKIPGVNTPYLYYGMWRSTFPWHVEDVELYSINYLHFGSPKFWYVIPPSFAREFESFVFEYFRSEFLNCRCFLRHKCVLISPLVLSRAGIPTKKIVQRRGEFMITFPYAYHAGFNTGLNIAESTNFALPRWINYGKRAMYCKCWDDTVKICMDPFVKKYQPNLFKSWKDGIVLSPHPLDEYSVNNKYGHETQSGCTSANLGETNDERIPVGDLNLIDMRYSFKRFRQANLPYHIAFNDQLHSLWCANQYDEATEKYFNHLIGNQRPHCAVCSFLWTPQHLAKVLSGFLTDDENMIPNEPHIPEVAYCKPPSSTIKLALPFEVKSPVVRCSRCFLTVHARCYGITEHIHKFSPNMQSKLKHESDPDVWLCDACQSPNRPSCVFCYLRGGALKMLANPSNNYTGRPYWAHLVCALATPGCFFMNIPERLAFISTGTINNALMDADDVSSDNEMSRDIRSSPTSDKLFEFHRCFRETDAQNSGAKKVRLNKFCPRIQSRKKCTVCRLPGRGQLPLASCWRYKCDSYFHVTCAQMAGVMIGTDVYPRFFYIACDKHPTNYHQHNISDLETVNPGDRIMIRESSNPPKFLPAVAIRAVTPVYCRISFPDGTYTSDTPPEYLANVDWINDGPPAKGALVKVLWNDNKEYVGTFEGTTSEKWKVRYNTGEFSVLVKERFYVVSRCENTS